MGRKKLATTMVIRDRITELRRVKASELLPNPRNWLRHPREQAVALQGILAEVGYADALLARETPDGLMLIDGHLRAETSSSAPSFLASAKECNISARIPSVTNVACAEHTRLRHFNHRNGRRTLRRRTFTRSPSVHAKSAKLLNSSCGVVQFGQNWLSKKGATALHHVRRCENNLGDLIDLPRGAGVISAKYDRPVAVLSAVEELVRFENLEKRMQSPKKKGKV